MRRLKQIGTVSNNRVLWRVAQGALLLLLVIFAGRYLLDQWEGLRGHPLSINWPVLIVAQIAVFAGLALLALPNLLLLRALGSPLPPLTVLRIWFLSNIAKYLPGSIWALPGRMFLYQRAGVSAGRSVVVVFWEVLALVLAAGLVTLLGWPLIDAYLPAGLMLLAVALVFAGLVVLLGLIHSRRWRGRVLSLPMPDRLRTKLARDDLWPSLPEFLRALAVSLMCWLLIGLGIAGMVYAISPEFEAVWWSQIAGLYAGAWLVGFVIVFTPGGIGVRDVLIGLGIGIILNDPLPAMVAILARILWTLAEITGVLVFTLLYERIASFFVRSVD